MNEMKRLLALCLCMMMLVSGAFAESAPAENTDSVPADAVLMTLDGKAVTAEDADATAILLYNNGYIENYPDYDAALDYILRDAVVHKHLQEAGYLDFTEEENAAFAAEAAQYWETLIGDYVDRYRTDASNEEEAKQLRVQAEEYYASLGGSLELIEGLGSLYLPSLSVSTSHTVSPSALTARTVKPESPDSLPSMMPLRSASLNRIPLTEAGRVTPAE